ncbi:unnamed protein product [Adineta ricciae]|uniref:Uncharacterized protein n=1 Tax=Adineta ricciae TaxID=249248 RepID=A0A815GW72_ADIRI|nr:unnamed protein product [Adineta ricciae]
MIRSFRRYHCAFHPASNRYVRLLVCTLIILFIQLLRCTIKHECTRLFLCPDRQLILYPETQMVEENQQSLCSQRSKIRGRHQHVIGVSAYLSKQDNKDLLAVLKTHLFQYFDEAKEKYPDWIVRVYYFSLNITQQDIHQIEAQYPNVDLCDSTNLPFLGNVVSWLPGKIQRFLPIVDPLVDIYMSRDVDSPILDRETTIVRTWLDSQEHTIHIIRDHPEHSVPILGGLWGIKTHHERSLVKDISQFLLSPDVVRCYTGRGDQTFLEDYIWPYANKHRDITLEYDSFLCKRFPHALPFPTRKQSPTLFVGCRRPNCTLDEHPECPKRCRPADHPDWIWC